MHNIALLIWPGSAMWCHKYWLSLVQVMVRYLGPLLLIKICQTSIWIRAWISNYIHVKHWAVIICPCPNFDGGLVKLLLKLGHGWVITSHRKQWTWLLIHAQISVDYYPDGTEPLPEPVVTVNLALGNKFQRNFFRLQKHYPRKMQQCWVQFSGSEWSMSPSLWPLLEPLAWYPLILVKSLQLIWRSGTRRFHLRVPNLQISCSDLI